MEPATCRAYRASISNTNIPCRRTSEKNQEGDQLKVAKAAKPINANVFGQLTYETDGGAYALFAEYKPLKQSSIEQLGRLKIIFDYHPTVEPTEDNKTLNYALMMSYQRPQYVRRSTMVDVEVNVLKQWLTDTVPEDATPGDTRNDRAIKYYPKFKLRVPANLLPSIDPPVLETHNANVFQPGKPKRRLPGVRFFQR